MWTVSAASHYAGHPHPPQAGVANSNSGLAGRRQVTLERVAGGRLCVSYLQAPAYAFRDGARLTRRWREVKGLACTSVTDACVRVLRRGCTHRSLRTRRLLTRLGLALPRNVERALDELRDQLVDTTERLRQLVQVAVVRILRQAIERLPPRRGGHRPHDGPHHCGTVRRLELRTAMCSRRLRRDGTRCKRRRGSGGLRRRCRFEVCSLIRLARADYLRSMVCCSVGCSV